jgi:hypothetical protein
MKKQDREFRIVAASGRTRFYFKVVIGLVAVLIAAVSFGMPWVGFLFVAAALIGLMIVLLSFLKSSQKTRFIFTDQGLRISGTLYGRTVPWSDLDLAGASVRDLGAHRELAPVIKTNGCAVPGYCAGWFRLKDWTKALVFLTDMSRTLVVPVQSEFVLLISPENPDEMLAALRDRAGA